MKTDPEKLKEMRKAAVDSAFDSYTGWKHKGGIALYELAKTVKSPRRYDKGISPYTLYSWIKSDLKESYTIIHESYEYWVLRK